MLVRDVLHVAKMKTGVLKTCGWTSRLRSSCQAVRSVGEHGLEWPAPHVMLLASPFEVINRRLQLRVGDERDVCPCGGGIKERDERGYPPFDELKSIQPLPRTTTLTGTGNSREAVLVPLPRITRPGAW